MLVGAECRRSFGFFFDITSSARTSDEFQTVARTPIFTEKSTGSIFFEFGGLNVPLISPVSMFLQEYW